MIYLSFQTDSPPLTLKEKLQRIFYRFVFGLAFVLVLTLVLAFILSMGLLSLIIGGVASLFMLCAYAVGKLFGWGGGGDAAWLDDERAFDDERTFMEEDLKRHAIFDFQEVRPPKSAKKQREKDKCIDAEFYEEEEKE